MPNQNGFWFRCPDVHIDRQGIAMNRLLVASTLIGMPLFAAAHDGHGLSGPHWHASDSWGFVALVALAAAALWSQRGGR